jgi:hypothetical protein
VSNPEKKEKTPCEGDLGKVLKFEVDKAGPFVRLYDTTPNACGAIITDRMGRGVEDTILVGVRHYTGPEGNMRELESMRETTRISIDFWNSLKHLQCCIHTVEGKDVLADNAGIARKELRVTK